MVPVPDPRLEELAGIAKSEKQLPATVEFVDIAGLVAGASKGEGLGNKFLSHIRETDAIAHVVRCFEDDDIVHVAGKIKPLDDVEVINTELALADLDTVERGLQRAEKAAKAGDKDAISQRDLLKKLKEHLDAGKPARSLIKDPEEKKLLLHGAASHHYQAADVRSQCGRERLHQQSAPRPGAGSAQLERIRQWCAVCAAIEAEIAQLEEADRADFLKDIGLEEPGLNRVIRAGYTLLGLQTYFTAGPKEARAWTVRIGATAPQSAACHSHRLRERLHPCRSDRVQRLRQLQGRAGREGSRQAAPGRQGIHRPGRRCHALPLQRLINVRSTCVDRSSRSWLFMEEDRKKSTRQLAL